ncbi:MAG: zinc ribbon domain-containing protein, partial [Pseudoruegeria sp.]
MRGFVTCGDCGVPLRSFWSTGRSKTYAYYLCQAKDCVSYGKSIPRDRIEDEVGQLIKDVEPSPGLVSIAKAMFLKAWAARETQAQETLHSAAKQVADIEKQIETVLGRIMSTNTESVIGAYEKKLSNLEAEKVRFEDMMLHH